MPEPGQRETKEELNNEQLVELAESVICNAGGVLTAIKDTFDVMVHHDQKVDEAHIDKIKVRSAKFINRMQANIVFVQRGEWQRYAGVEEFLKLEIILLEKFKSIFEGISDEKIRSFVKNWNSGSEDDIYSPYEEVLDTVDQFQEMYLMKKMKKAIVDAGYGNYTELSQYSI